MEMRFSSLTQKVLKVKILQNIPNFILWNDEKTSSSMCCSMWINCWRGFIRMIIPEDLSTTYPTVWISLRDAGLFPFVRNGRPDHSHHYENLTFNQNCVARSVKSWTICMGLMGFLVKTLLNTYFIFKMTSLASQFWLLEITLSHPL